MRTCTGWFSVHITRTQHHDNPRLSPSVLGIKAFLIASLPSSLPANIGLSVQAQPLAQASTFSVLMLSCLPRLCVPCRILTSSCHLHYKFLWWLARACVGVQATARRQEVLGSYPTINLTNQATNHMTSCGSREHQPACR